MKSRRSVVRCTVGSTLHTVHSLRIGILLKVAERSENTAIDFLPFEGAEAKTGLSSLTIGRFPTANTP